MDDLELFDTPIADAGDMTALLFRFLFNCIFVGVIILGLYYPKSRKREYFFTFALISVSIFFLIYLLGLFAIFGIIRYRTESMSVREMTYLFVIIAMSVINALAVTLSYGELVMTNLIFIAMTLLCERMPFIGSRLEKLVLYDRIDLIVPEKREELIEDLHKRLGINIVDIEIGAVDFLHDTAMLKVVYTDRQRTTNTVDKMLKFPKVNQ